MRILSKFLGFPHKQSEKIINNRIILKRRQQKSLQLAESLPSNPEIIKLSLQQLSKGKGQQKFGSFVRRCVNPSFQKLNFLADVNIQNALKLNNEGIPFTVKDHIKVEDLIQTCGFSHNVTPSFQNAELINILLKHGCVPFAHTNVPQGLLNIQTNNNIYGLSLNPYKKEFISGGSSGGEAVSVATKCSAFGVCSDAAGSARIPASFCGVVGFKPTGSNRISKTGKLGVTGKKLPCIQDLDSSLGLMTRNIDDLAWLCERAIGKSLKKNPYMEKEWNKNKFQEYKQKKLRFGYLFCNNQMEVATSIKNAMKESIQLLKNDGHEVLEFEFANLHKFRDFVIQTLTSIYCIQGAIYRLGEQNQIKQASKLYERGKYGRIGTQIKEWLSSTEKQKKFYSNFNISKKTSDLLTIISQKDLVSQEFIRQWNESGIDVLLTPVMPFTALLSQSSSFLISQLTYCSFQNVLQMPAGSLPIRLVKKQEAKYEDNGFYGQNVKSSILRSEGLPIGLQITGPHQNDEVCVAGMWHLQKLLQPFPSPPE